MSSSSLSSQFLLFHSLQSYPTLYPPTKHLSKSHPSTKTKALQTIIRNLPEELGKRDDDGVGDGIAVKVLLHTNGLWDFLSIIKMRLSLDQSRQIRLLSWQLFGTLIELHPEIKKAICDMEDRYLEHIVGSWFLAMHDTDPDMQKYTRQLFQQCFSSKKQLKVLQRFKHDILALMVSYFNQSVLGLMTVLKLKEKDEAEETFARFITMSLSALRTMIARLKALQSDDEQLAQLLSNKHFWKYLIIEQFPTIRVAAFQLVGAVCETCPKILEPHLKIMAPLVLSCFQERDPMVQQYTMEALIIFLQKFPVAWQYVHVWKVVFPKLFGFLRNASTSFPSKTFSILLPFLSMLNFEILGSSNEKSEAFFNEYFESMWMGFMQEETQDFDRNFIINAYVESIMFAVMRSERYVQDAYSHQLHQLLLSHFMRAMELFLASPSKVADPQHFASQFITLMTKFHARSQTKALLADIWTRMWNTSQKVLNHEGQDAVALRNTFVQRLDSLLSQLHHTNEDLLQDASQNEGLLTKFARPLMALALERCISVTDDAVASVFLDTCVVLCDVIPVEQVGADQKGNFFSGQFFADYVEPIFMRFRNVASKSVDIREKLCDFLSHFFEACPCEFSKLESLMRTEDLNLTLLYHMVLKCFSVFGEDLDRSITLERIVDRILFGMEAALRGEAEPSTAMHVEENAQFMELVLIQFPNSLSDEQLSSTIVRLAKILHEFANLPVISRRQFSSHIPHIISLLESLCKAHMTLFETKSMDMMTISDALFVLCVYEDVVHMDFVTRAFWNECLTNGFVDADDWEQYSDLEGMRLENRGIDADARRVWKSVMECIAHVSPNDIPTLFSDSEDFLKLQLQSNHTSSQVSHRPVVATMQLVDEVSQVSEYSSTKSSMDAFVRNKSLWEYFRHEFDESTTCMQVDGKSFLVSSPDTQPSLEDNSPHHDSHHKFQSVFNYSRFIMTMITYLQNSLNSEQFQSLFLDNNSMPNTNIWIFYQIYFANERNSLFHYKVRRSLSEMRDRIQQTFWAVNDEQWMPCMESIIQLLIKLCATNDPRTELIFVGKFIRDTLEYLHRRAKTDRRIATEHMDALLDYCLETLLFSKSFEETLDDSIHCALFDVVIESLFQFSDEEITTFVNDHLNRRITMSDTYYTAIVEWLSKSVSLLLTKTLDVVQENLTTQDMTHQLYNLLSLQSSLTLLNNFVRQIETDENRVSTDQMVRVLSDFTTSMMDSYEYCNSVLPQVEHLVAKMLSIIYKSISPGEVAAALGDEREDHDAFVATFFQQHCLVVLSSFDKKESSFDDVRSRLQNFAIMEAMASAFLEKRSETRAAVETSRLLFHSMTTFFSIEKESLESRRNLTFYAIIGRLQQKVCTSLMYVTERIYTSLDKEAKRRMSKQMIQILRESRHPHAQLAAGHSLRSYENLSCLFVDKKSASSDGAAVNRFELDHQFAELLHQCPVEISARLTEPLIIEFSSGASYQNHRYELFSYLLAWDALCKLSDKSSKELKSVAFVAVKTKQSFHLLLNLLFSFVLHTSQVQQNIPGVDQLFAPYITFEDISKDDASVALSLTHDAFTLFAAQLILKMVHSFPSLVMTWYKSSAMSTSVHKALTDFISQRLAPQVIEKELVKIQQRSGDVAEHIKIQVLKNIGRIRCMYNQDDIELDLTLEIPPTYPLKAIEMKSSKRSGVSEATWRKVILKMTSMLFKDAGNIFDSIQLWVENLDKHFSGYEPCPICYSILNLESSLPDKKCSQCKQMFHSSCLVKWFASSPEPTCPYCRGLNTFH
mmetsp:Transcript_9699/g.36018  ORF Transcript_9699/g.36018 Transcript_9699/m.36018 type:complete len:1784 (-) Transcript_9699:146-5497(-)